MNIDEISKGLEYLAQTTTDDTSTIKSVHSKTLSEKTTGQEVEKLLQEREALLKVPRRMLQKNISVVEYLSEERIARVIEKKGSQWNSIGHYNNGQYLLYPEELIYGMELGIMIVYELGVPWTVQQAYHTLLRTTEQLLMCQVYLHLKRAGYIVMRRNIEGSKEKSFVLDVYKCQHKPFKKSSPGPPSYVVLVVTPQDTFPSVAETEYIIKKFVPKQTQLKYAIIDNGTVTVTSNTTDGINTAKDL